MLTLMHSANVDLSKDILSMLLFILGIVFVYMSRCSEIRYEYLILICILSLTMVYNNPFQINLNDTLETNMLRVIQYTILLPIVLYIVYTKVFATSILPQYIKHSIFWIGASLAGYQVYTMIIS